MKREFGKLRKAEQERIELEYHQMSPGEFDELMAQAMTRVADEHARRGQQEASLANKVVRLADRSGVLILSSEEIPGRAATYKSVPLGLHPTVYHLLTYEYPNGLYSHQAESIQSALDENDICLATPTASGKSLVFMALAADLLKRNSSARVLALYPSKALIQDQLNKWKQILGQLGVDIGYIDGAVPSESRPSILDRHRIVIMTPDVTHAWLMSHLGSREVTKFISNLRLLILDEAHVYEGVFGSNMAYLLRRIEAVSPLQRIISSTATIGSPEDFIEKLTGRRPRVFDNKDNGSRLPPKTILLARTGGSKQFEAMVDLVAALSTANVGRFLAFADSRKMVEQLVAATRRGPSEGQDETRAPEELEGAEDEEDGHAPRVLPYRAGYEEEDRQAIQRALERGQLAGVVSTSALELGLDIGEIDVVLLLGTPPSVRAFWQRIGRAGRKHAGVCLLLDNRRIVSSDPAGLQGFLNRPVETGWLYLENRFIQYANALCAAIEISPLGRTTKPFESLPPRFLQFLQNELNPTEIVPDELYPLKQRAQAGPHYEFPLRSGIEKSFSVRYRQGAHEDRLGTLTYSQALREAYPGAVYHYMARPYRVYQFNYNLGEITVKREKQYSTQPTLQTMVFPKFQGGLLTFSRSEQGFLAEAELQVSERVLGFSEQRGSSKNVVPYGPGSPYAQRPLTRFFETTGVCWYFSNHNLLAEKVAATLLDAFCSLCGVQSRDLGVGTFHSNALPFGDTALHGKCIYDASTGSLRLTQQLMERFRDVAVLASRIVESQDDHDRPLEEALSQFGEVVTELRSESTGTLSAPSGPDSDWVTIIAPGQIAVCLLGNGSTEEVKVLAYRYTPQGLMYDLESPKREVSWSVRASTVIPINGLTKLIRANLMTGQTSEPD
jgi:DEAD/DEAH box helicase domain-containing protein